MITKKLANIKILFFIVFIGMMVVLFISLKKDDKNTLLKVDATIKFDGVKFEITNSDTIDFSHAEISIDNYYKIRDVNLVAGETYSIWKVEFLHHNGTHFPPDKTPGHFTIWCQLADGRNGFFSKKIN